MTARAPAAPRDLSPGGRRLWRSIVTEYELRADELKLLEHICRTTDELAVMCAQLPAAELLVTGSMGQPRPHPLLAEIRGHRAVLARLVSQLGLVDALDEAEEPASMPPASRRAQRAALARWGSRGTA
jgi:phage terminase small subunit